MTKGWHNQPYRHSLASKGVKTGKDIPKQVWIDSKREFMKKRPIKNDKLEIESVKNVLNENKPSGGLWTSSKMNDDGYFSEWHKHIEKKNVEGFDGVDRVFLLKPKENAKIYQVDSVDDWYNLFKNYEEKVLKREGITSPDLGFIDFERVSNYFDGIHLTKEGLNEIWKYNQMGKYKKDGNPKVPIREWGVESTLWFRDVFDVIERFKR